MDRTVDVVSRRLLTGEINQKFVNLKGVIYEAEQKLADRPEEKILTGKKCIIKFINFTKHQTNKKTHSFHITLLQIVVLEVLGN